MIRNISEHDEYLLSLLLDNDLPEDQATALRHRLESEPNLRACYDELVRLNAALQARRTTKPAVQLEGFHAKLMQRLHETPAIGEADELLISRSLDGDLLAGEQQELQQRLENEPALQQRHDEYSRLDAVLKAKRAAQPEVNYSQFHRQLMDKVDAESPATERTVRFPAWLRLAAPLAAAAALALVVWLQPLSLRPGRDAIPPVGPVALNGPDTDDSGADLNDNRVEFARRTPATASGSLEVAYGRLDKPADSQSMQVNFARSTELADAIRQVDEESASRPAKKVFFASARPVNRASSGGLDGDFLDAAPM